ncbi:putative ATP-grasp target RiPP [Streptosporangium sp. NPDC049644]|uniref:putative ATP-grasp target RiPP n=1 Tax=Streptosporangium sp. NPDC049644 TaxID=3155507 RepID=UPI0034456611
MSEIKIDDIAATGTELNENDLRLVSGGRPPANRSSKVIDGITGAGDGTVSSDPDF